MRDFPIPPKALESHIALLGKTGSGKTTAAKGMVENVLDAGGRACAIDPTGVWHGLRSNASGKGAGYPVVIFGGPHGDVPLGAHHGEAIAEIVGTSSTSAVIDTSTMRVSERTRFFADFGDALIRKNKGPLHLVIDEAHLFMPQGRVADPQSGQMLHAANNLVSLGRSRGLRITIISQRPAKVHKDALTQVETLVAMRLIAPQDRRAVEDWIADNADQAKGKEIIASLATLKTGDAWIWAPEIGILERAHFPRNRTFDSSRAPDGDESGIVLAPINLKSVHERLGTIEAEAKANDPRALKAKVADLERQLKQQPKAAPNEAAALKDREAAFAAGVKQGRETGYPEGWLDGERGGFTRGVAEGVSVLNAATREIISKAAAVEYKPGTPPKRIPKSDVKYAEPMRTLSAPVAQRSEHRASNARTTGSTPAGRSNGHDDLSTPQRRIVSSLAFWKNIGHDAPTRAQVAAVAGYSPGSGGFGNLIGALNSAGWVTIPMAGRVALARDYESLSPDEARAKMRSVLSNPQLKLLDAALTESQISRDDLGARTDYSPSSGGFGNLIGSLSTLGIFVKPAPGYVAVSDWAREVLS